jgi:hypothetical protein
VFEDKSAQDEVWEYIPDKVRVLHRPQPARSDERVIDLTCSVGCLQETRKAYRILMGTFLGIW